MYDLFDRVYPQGPYNNIAVGCSTQSVACKADPANKATHFIPDFSRFR